MLAVSLLGACSRGSVQNALGLGKRSPDEFAVVTRAPLVVPPDFNLRPPEPGAPRPNVGNTSDRARVALTGSQAGEPSEAARVLADAAPPPVDGNTLTGRGPTEGLPGGTSPGSVADQVLAAGTRAPAGARTATPAPPAVDGAVAPTSAPTGGATLTRGEQAMVQLAGGNQADPGIRRTIAEENQALADVEASLFTRILAWREPSTLGATIDAPAEAQRLRDNKIAGRSPTEGDTPTVLNRRQSALQGVLEGIF